MDKVEKVIITKHIEEILSDILSDKYDAKITIKFKPEDSKKKTEK